MNDIELLTDTLKQSGVRITPQRLAIYKLLVESEAHPTASVIYEQIRTQFPSISLMTVYNTLETLVHLGLVNSLGSIGDDNVHYDGNTSSHINLACITCHKIVDINLPENKSQENRVSVASGFQLIGARMMYYGFCPDCQKQTNITNKKE